MANTFERTIAPLNVRGEEPEWVVWLTVLVGLLIGAFLHNAALSSTKTTSIDAGSLQYPAGWAAIKQPDTLFAAEDRSSAPFSTRVTVTQLPAQAPAGGGVQSDLADIASNWAITRGDKLEGYRVLGITPTEAGGAQGINVEYAYLATPTQGSAANSLPGLMHAIDTVVARGGGYQALSFSAEQSAWNALQPTRSRIVASWRGQ